MAREGRGSFGSFTRGAEIWMHQIRMAMRSVLTAVSAGAVLGCIAGGLWFWLRVPTEFGRGLLENWEARARHFLSLDAQPMTVYDGSAWVKVKAVDAIRLTQGMADLGEQHLRNVLIVGGLATFMFSALIVLFWFNYGRTKLSDSNIRGTNLLSGPELAKMLRQRKEASPYVIADVPMRAKSENLNTLIVGAQGVGKTQAFFAQMRQVRARGKRAIVYDPTGEFMQEFYRPGKDILLNPMDSRCVFWTVWHEIKEEYHFDALANGLIPSPPDDKDPFWAKAGRHVLKDAYKVLGREGRRTNKDLYNAISKSNLEGLHLLLQGEAGATYVDPKTERTGMSLKMTVQNQLESFRFLPDTGTPFSIRDYIAEDSDSWLFFSCPASMREALTSVMSLWVELVIKSVLDLPPVHREKLWLFLDEIPTLQKLDSLVLNVTNTRKHGLCTVIGIQDFSLFYAIYGEHAARTIISGCQTKLLMRVTDGEAAELLCKTIGENDVDEKEENLSYGHNATRDGVTVMSRRNLRKVVLPSQIMRLPDMTGYYVIPGDYPVARVELKFVAPAVNVEGFIRRDAWNTLYGQAEASAANPQATQKSEAGAPNTANAPAPSSAGADVPARDPTATAPKQGSLHGVLSPKRAPAQQAES